QLAIYEHTIERLHQLSHDGLILELEQLLTLESKNYFIAKRQLSHYNAALVKNRKSLDELHQAVEDIQEVSYEIVPREKSIKNAAELLSYLLDDHAAIKQALSSIEEQFDTLTNYERHLAQRRELLLNKLDSLESNRLALEVREQNLALLDFYIQEVKLRFREGSLNQKQLKGIDFDVVAQRQVELQEDAKKLKRQLRAARNDIFEGVNERLRGLQDIRLHINANKQQLEQELLINQQQRDLYEEFLTQSADFLLDHLATLSQELPRLHQSFLQSRDALYLDYFLSQELLAEVNVLYDVQNRYKLYLEDIDDSQPILALEQAKDLQAFYQEVDRVLDEYLATLEVLEKQSATHSINSQVLASHLAKMVVLMELLKFKEALQIEQIQNISQPSLVETQKLFQEAKRDIAFALESQADAQENHLDESNFKTDLIPEKNDVATFIHEIQSKIARNQALQAYEAGLNDWSYDQLLTAF
ncbi:MAG: hypothetical protein R2865_08885, partial [Deinococcales bacterium]